MAAFTLPPSLIPLRNCRRLDLRLLTSSFPTWKCRSYLESTQQFKLSNAAQIAKCCCSLAHGTFPRIRPGHGVPFRVPPETCTYGRSTAQDSRGDSSCSAVRRLRGPRGMILPVGTTEIRSWMPMSAVGVTCPRFLYQMLWEGLI